MTEQQNHLQDIREIKTMMEKSTKFLSLSGLSGVSAGVIALIGAAIGYYIMDFGSIKYDEFYRILPPHNQQGSILPLFILGVVVLLSALASGFYFSWRKAKKQSIPFLTRATFHLVTSMFIPIVTGGILCLIMFFRHEVSWLASITLIFYGLGLVSASKYTHKEVQYLGLSEIVLGLFSAIFLNYGLFFWALGFGVFHIVYGIVAYIRYEK